MSIQTTIFTYSYPVNNNVKHLSITQSTRKVTYCRSSRFPYKRDNAKDSDILCTTKLLRYSRPLISRIKLWVSRGDFQWHYLIETHYHWTSCEVYLRHCYKGHLASWGGCWNGAILWSHREGTQNRTGKGCGNRFNFQLHGEGSDRATDTHRCTSDVGTDSFSNRTVKARVARCTPQVAPVVDARQFLDRISVTTPIMPQQKTLGALSTSRTSTTENGFGNGRNSEPLDRYCWITVPPSKVEERNDPLKKKLSNLERPTTAKDPEKKYKQNSHVGRKMVETSVLKWQEI